MKPGTTAGALTELPKASRMSLHVASMSTTFSPFRATVRMNAGES